MDNVSYNSVQAETTRRPPSNARKAELHDWLVNHGVDFDPQMISAELWELVKTNLPPVKFCVDELAEDYGFEILRLPPCHCDLNPIELIWPLWRIQWPSVRKRSDLLMWNAWLRTRSVRKLTDSDWQEVITHTTKVDEKYWEVDNIVDNNIQLIIGLGEHDGESESNKDTSAEEEEVWHFLKSYKKYHNFYFLNYFLHSLIKKYCTVLNLSKKLWILNIE